MNDEQSLDMQAASPTMKAPVTISHVLGELTWLVSQSLAHEDLRISDIQWLLMPAVLKKQFHLFRTDGAPVAAVIWAKLDSNAESRIQHTVMEQHLRLQPDEWDSGENIWLVDLIVPFADATNKHFELVFADLLTGIFKGKSIKIINKSSHDSRDRVVTIEANAGSELTATLVEELKRQGVLGC